MEKDHVLDATNGPVLKPLIAFSVPIMLANILQLLFNAADIIVVGQFVGETAVAAVGSAVIISMLISLFMGLSIGATVVMSTKLGSGATNISRTIQTTYTLGIFLGVLTAVVGFILAPSFLGLLNTPNDIIGQADLYLRIVFLGQPGFMVYTFVRAILVAKGDTRSPLIYLFIAGAVNVVLNIILVSVVRLGVAGVAIATITSHYISAVITVRKLVHTEGMFHLNIKGFCLDRTELKGIIRLGVPTGLQSTLISVSGLLTQSSINSLGTAVVAGQSASNNIMSFLAQALNAFSQGCMTFSGQNYGAGRTDRVRKVYRSTLLIDAVLGSLLGCLIIVFGEDLLHIYTPDSAASVTAGMVGLTTIMSFSILMGFQDASGFALRGMNYSVFPMLTAVFGNCIFRVFWIAVLFNRLAPDMETLSAYRFLVSAYPVSWAIIFAANSVAYFVIMRKEKQDAAQNLWKGE